jgi:hypothetical protein
MDANEFVKSFSKLGSAYFTEYTRNVERYARFVAGMAQQPVGTTSTAQAQERYVEFLRTEFARVSSALAEASLNYYNAVINTGIDVANRFFEQVVQPEKTDSSLRTASPKPSALLFHGAPGASPANAFVVSNNRSQPVEVRFEVTEMSNEDGTVRFEPSAKFVPEICRLAPNSEQIVQCSILLTEQYQAGATYRAHIRVVGIPEMTIGIMVQVEESAEPRPKSARKK